MKHILLTFLGLYLLLGGILSQDTINSPNTNAAVIHFEETVYNYGTIDQNSNGNCEFKFLNNGTSALILSNVRSSCGCTVPDWPKDPIKPGGEAVISVKYNTSQLGRFNKGIVVYSNGSEQPVILRIKGNVIKKSNNK